MTPHASPTSPASLTTPSPSPTSTTSTSTRHPAKHGAPWRSGQRDGAGTMVGQVVPVWQQQVQLARQQASAGAHRVQHGFGQIADALVMLAQRITHAPLSASPGALDAALAGDGPAHAALQQLLAASQRAFAQRDAAVAQLAHCSQALQALRQLGREAQELGKHTRLVAFNALIEAQRVSQGNDGGSQAIANETRMLAQRMADVGAQVGQLVARLDSTLAPELAHGETADTSPDELRQELALRARTALASLVGAISGELRHGTDIQAAANTLGQQVQATRAALGFASPLEQMLDNVSADMRRFAGWVPANPDATQGDAADWLARLEASYTLPAQRAQHHGNLHIDVGPGL